MAKFLCVCGETIRTSGGIPNTDEWHCISDVQLDRLYGDGDSVSVGLLHERSTLVFLCPNSGHLWVFWDGFGGEPTLYTPTPSAHVSSGRQ
ncbi:MAG: hypothetical protein DHS20C19_20060 [Acidimicrobiales bacterium]|nr:MAG: hypothetical protein DHS20C19_20060 [Acidimicrobiales bacterium]